MKKNLLFFVAFLGFTTMVAAQSVSSENIAGTKALAPEPPKPFSTQLFKSQLAACGPDTIVYPYLKELIFSSPNDSFFIDAMVGNVRAASQAYHTSSTITIKGVQFWGGAYSTTVLPQLLQARVYVYIVDANNMPISVVDSADVIITQNYDFYHANFTTPVVLSQNFAVGVKSVPNDTLAVITNNAGASWQTPNYGEALACRRFGSGVWNSSLSFFGQDLEYMIFPIVEYNVTSSFNAVDTICPQTTINFANTSSMLFENRFLNLHAFDEYWNFTTINASYEWNYGDSATWYNTVNGTRSYGDTGTYEVQLASEMLGYYTSCSDTASVDIVVTAPVVTAAGFSEDTLCHFGPVVNLPAASPAGGTWTGPGVTGSDFSPMTAGAGYHMLIYTYTDPSGCPSSDTVYITVEICGGIESFAGADINLFPNPAGDQLHINAGEAFTGSEITVYDLAGRDILHDRMESNQTVLSLGDLQPGVYIILVAGKNQTAAGRFIKQ